jgi:hypothetical protein
VRTYCVIPNIVQMHIGCLTVSISVHFSIVECTAFPDILG